jgi:TetR/AcrR family transcriptional repressor of nem operon
MGITGPSLYNAFSDKRTLFRKALERYMRDYARARINELEAALPPKDAVRAFLKGIVEHSLDDPGRRGCLLVNAALEIGPHDPEIGSEIAEKLGEIEGFYLRMIKAAQEAGTVPRDRDPQDLARLLMGVTLGIRVLARSKPDRQLLEGMARPALALLEGPLTLGSDRVT